MFLDAFTHRTAPRGWASVIVAVLFMGSMQMIGLGIVGEYVRLIFLEAKGRPTYIVAGRQTSVRAIRGGFDRRPKHGLPPSPCQQPTRHLSDRVDRED